MKRITLANKNFKHSNYFYKGDLTLCVTGLRRYVEVPKDAPSIDIVFTKKETSYSFEITLLRTYGAGVYICKVYGFKHIKPSLSTYAENLLERMFDKGYRFVHVEI